MDKESPDLRSLYVMMAPGRLATRRPELPVAPYVLGRQAGGPAAAVFRNAHTPAAPVEPPVNSHPQRSLNV